MDYENGSSSGTILWRVVRAVVPWIGLVLVVVAVWSFLRDYREASSGTETTTSTVEATSTESAEGAPYVRVISEGLNLRTEPSTTAAVVTQLAADQRVQFIEEKSGWYHVRTADGAAEGWIAAGGQYSELVEP